MMKSVHRPVLLEEVLEWLAPQRPRAERFSLLFDGTLGGGGHAERLLQSSPRGFLIGTDCDSAAVRRVEERLGMYAGRFYIAEAGYEELEQVLDAMPEELKQLLTADRASTFPLFQAMLLDLGISSDQLDNPARGFSFLHDSPLDMRMAPDSGIRSAADLVNTCDEKELRRIFLRGGVKPQFAAALSKEILRCRPISTTAEFADLCGRLYRRPKKKTGPSRHPATVPFQALRIEVNQEFAKLERFLDFAGELLAPQGRLAVISFHSAEDQIVTRVMRRWSRSDSDRFAPVPARPFGTLLTKQAIFPREEEMSANPRARSARLRVFERAADQPPM
jgi:16S rRNA (cytosine1402-N4)-methyltransferase